METDGPTCECGEPVSEAGVWCTHCAEARGMTQGPRWDKRRNNRASSRELLVLHGVQFTSKNDGAHLIVVEKQTGMVIDFWPATGKWVWRDAIDYGDRTEGRGVFNLLKHMGVKLKRGGG